MSDTQTVLFANDTFYAAFASRDTAAMDAVWSDTTTITCLHPGWPPLAGRDDVLDSWHAILGADSAPAIECRAAEAFVTGDTARVICFEVIGGTALVATNFFVRDAPGWKLIHHQSGPTAAPPPAEAEALSM